MKNLAATMSSGLNLVAAAIGALIAVSILGLQSPRTTYLQSQLDQFQQLTLAQQERMHASSHLLISQPESRRQKYHEMQQAISEDAALAETLKHFGKIWNSLDSDDLDEWDRYAQDRNSRLQLVASHWQQDPAARSTTLNVTFLPSYDPFFPRLELSTDEYWQFLQQIIPLQQLPENVQQTLDELSVEMKALSLGIWLVEHIPDTPDQQDPENLLEHLNRAEQFLVNDVADRAWAAKFAAALERVKGRRWRPSWSIPIIYDITVQCMTQIGDRVATHFPVAEQQMLLQFDQLKTSERSRMMARTPWEFRNQLELLSRRNPPAGPEHQLLSRYFAYSSDTDQIVSLRQKWIDLAVFIVRSSTSTE